MDIRGAVLRDMSRPTPYTESKPLQIETITLDEPGPGEVLVKVRAAGLCHSDLSVINGSRPRPLPMVLGHEVAGEVAQVGEGVVDLHPGDHVVCAFVPACGHCLPCQEGRPALCEPGAAANTAGTLLSGAHRIHQQGEIIHHHLGISGFAEYAVMSRSSLIRVDGDIPFDELALFGCAVMTGVGAVVNTARIAMGSSVGIVGLGGVGLSALLGARAAGARRIVAIDVNQAKLQQALELGATDVFDARDPDLVAKVKDLTRGGLEYVFETAGAVPAMQTAFFITKRGGMTVTTGLPDKSDTLSIPHMMLTAEERTIKGSYVGSCVPSRDIPRFIELYRQGRLPVDRLLTDRLPLEDINEGFDRLARGDASRLVVVL